MPGRVDEKEMKDNQKRKMNSINGREPLRLVALTDGLFATVLTLLVLDLRIPEALNTDGGNITVFARWVGPHLFSYLLTFWVSGVYWLSHHRDFDYVIHYDRGLLGYNLLFLLFIGLFPFSTATMANFKSSAYPFYWAIYAANIILAGVMLTLTWNYAVSHHLVHPEITSRQCRHITVRHIVTPGVFLLSIVAECLFPQALLGPCTLLVIPLALRLADRLFAHAKPSTQFGHSDLRQFLWRAGTILPWILIIGLAVWAMTLKVH